MINISDYSLSAQLRARDAGFSSVIKSAQKAVENLKSTADKLKSEQDLKMKVGVDGMARIERLKSAIEAARQNSNKPLSVRLRDQATQQLSKLRTEINALTSKAHNIVANVKVNGAEKLKGIKNSLSEGIGGAAMGMGATMLGTAGIGYGVVNAVQSQMNFEKQMSAVKAILSGSYSGEELNKQMVTLTALAEKMGATTKFTAKEAGDALYFMGMAGWKTEQMVAGLPAVLNLAAAGNTDLATTSDIVTDSMTAFGLKAGKTVKNAKGQTVEMSQHYADLMAALVTNANTDVVQAGETLKYAAANVGAMFANGTDEDRMRGAEDMFLITGLMANAGIKSSQAGTSARALFARLGSQNRNASWALEALGVDFTDENYGGTGEVRRIRDIIGDLRSRFKEGVSPEQLLDFAETLEGTKLHADTRRKLEKFIEKAQANGGKLPGGEMLKMAALLNGQEGMSGLLSVLLASEEDFNKLASAIDNADGAAEKMAAIQLDNLAGSITLLGSAWDAFQRSFVKGSAGDGLRSFVDSVTDSLTKANKLFEDGIDFSDLVALGADAVTKLKNKFLELDGIGSLLAGGALFMGLKKIASLALSVKDTIGGLLKIRSAADLGNAIRGKQAAGGLQTAAAMNVNVSTMNVRAGVVNLSGTVKGGTPAMGGAAGKGAVIAANQQRVDAYYQRRQQILTSGTTSGRPIPPATATGGVLGTLKGGLKAGGGMLALSALLGAFDVYSTRTNSEYNNNLAVDELNAARSELKMLQEQGADITQINSQLAKIQSAEENVRTIAETGRLNERRANAGVAGMLAGTAAGAALGSVVPIIGTAIGAMIGGFLGQYGGEWFADNFGEVKKTKTQTPEEIVSRSSAALSRHRQQDIEERERPAKERATSEFALKNYSSTIARHRDEDRIEWESSHFATPDEVVIGAGKAMIRRRDDNTKELQKLQRDAYNAEIQANIKKHQQQENLKNFGYTSLWQDYSTPAESETRAIDYKKKYSIGNEESARQRNISTNANGQEYVNLNQGAFTNWLDSLKAKFAGTETPAQTKNFTPPSATALPFTTTQTPFKTLEKSAVDLSGAFKSVKTPLDEIKGYTPAETPKPMGIPEIKVPKYDYSKAFQNLPTYSPAETPKPMGMPELTPPKYDYSAATQNLPGYTPAQNLTPITMPNLEMPELNIAEKISAGLETVSTVWEILKTSASSTFEEISTSISTGLESAKNSVASFGEEISMSMTTGFETIKTSISSFGEGLSTNFGTSFETLKTSLATFGEEFSTSFSTSFETLKTSAAAIFEEISMTATAGLESLQMSVTSIGENISMSFSTSFETISTMAATTFSSLSASISGGVESARATITTAFSSAAAEVQGIWGAIPGFFSGIFGGLGGIAAGAGAAIAAGINSGIGMIQSAWEALSGWLSAKISSLASMASSAAASIGIGSNAKGTAYWRGGFTEVNEHGGELIILPSGKEIYPYSTTQNVLQETKIAHNAKGTSFFSGGWSEVNEHGGELMYLPTGTKIIPHATTVRILREQIKEKLQNGNSYAFNQQSTIAQNSATSNVGYNKSAVADGMANVRATFGTYERHSGRFNADSGSSIQTEISKTSQVEKIDELGNLKGVNIPEYNRITADDSIAVKRAKQQAQRRQNSATSTSTANNRTEKQIAVNDSAQSLKIAHNYSGTSFFSGGLTTVNEHGGEIISLPNGKTIFPQFTTQNIFKRELPRFDELGNLKGVNIPEYNRITADDSIAVKRAKQQVQRRQFLGEDKNGQFGNSTIHSIFSNVGGRFLQIGYTAGNQKRNEISSGNITGLAVLPLGKRQPISPVDYSGNVERYNSSGTFYSFSELGNLKNEKQQAPFNSAAVYNQSRKSQLNHVSSFSNYNPFFYWKNGEQFASKNSTTDISNVADNSQKIISNSKIFAPQNNRARNRQPSMNPLDILVNVFKRSSPNNRSIKRAGNILSTIQNAKRNVPISLSTPTTFPTFNNRQTRIAGIGDYVKNFGDNQLSPFETLNNFSFNQLDELPVPQISPQKTAATSNNHSTSNTSNTTNNSNSSNVSFNFGGVNISNGMDFDNFTHKLMTLFTQGASNSVLQ
ncbi:MAG: phage tail tape measure protein [Selenomonadaceae bacterium]|nr:phage tail tape measure protein [Selenomonadaceae bacterium]